MDRNAPLAIVDSALIQRAVLDYTDAQARLHIGRVNEDYSYVDTRGGLSRAGANLAEATGLRPQGSATSNPLFQQSSDAGRRHA